MYYEIGFIKTLQTSEEGQPTTTLLAQLTYSPLYIITVIVALGVLIFLRSEKGCLMFLIRIWAVGHIIIYLLAIYFNLTTLINAQFVSTLHKS